MGRNAELARRYAIWIVVALLLLSGEAFAQATPEDEARDLSDKLWVVQSLSRDFPDGPFWRTWGLLRDDAAAALQRHPGDGALTTLRNDILLQWGTLLVAKGEPDRAEEQLLELVPADVPEKWRFPAASALAGISEARAEAAETRDEKVRLYREAEVYLAQAKQTDELARVQEIRFDIQAEAGLEAYEAKEYGRAFDLLAQLKEEEGSLKGTALERYEDLVETTGILQLDFLSVTVPGASVREGGRLRLMPVGGGVEWSGATPETLRWKVGTYRFELSLGDGTGVAVEDTVTIATDAKASVTVPEKVPDGMVFVAGSKDDGGPGPFFMDRTEVTVGEYRAYDASYRPRFPEDDFPAHGITYEQALAYAKAKGRALPTLEQWTWAAFEGSSRRFPWVGTDIAGRCNPPGSGKPTPVGSFPDGASPFGVLDMVGNVWEWLDSEAAIGGGFRVGATLDYYAGTEFDPIRSPKPSESKYASFDDTEKEKYRLYKVTWTGVGKNIQEVGFRCVLNL